MSDLELDNLIADIKFFDDWEDKYKYIIVVYIKQNKIWRLRPRGRLEGAQRAPRGRAASDLLFF